MKPLLIATLTIGALTCAAQTEAAFTSDTVSGMALWLKADEGVIASGNEVDVWADASGSGNDLWAPSTTGRPITATATFGNGTHDVLRFDGIDDVLTLGALPNLPFQDHTAFFVAARTGGASAQGNLFGFDMTGGRAGDGWYYKLTAGAINMESGLGSDYGYKLAALNPNDTFAIGEGRYAGGDNSARLYVNGQLLAEDSAAASAINEPAGTAFNIGAFNTASAYTNFLQGDIAEILVFDRALNQTEQETVRAYLQDKYGIEGYVPPEPLPLELRASWSFDQDGADSVGGHDMTLGAEATIVPAVVGNGLQVSPNGEAGSAYAAPSADLDVTHQFSAAMWVNLAEDTGIYSRLLSRMEDDQNGYNIAIDTLEDGMCKLIVRVMKDGGNMFVRSTDQVLNVGEFHHIAFAFDALQIDPTLRTTLWVDGVPVSVEDTSTAGGVQGTPNFVLGRGTAASAEMSGILDEVRFYTGVLTQADVDALIDVGGPALEGDLNGDGTVSSADLDIVRGNWGQAVTPGDLSAGDANGDGTVSSADLDIVRANWGNTAAAAVVPEPSAAVLLLLGLCFWASRRR